METNQRTEPAGSRGRGPGTMLPGLRDARRDAGLSLRELQERTGVWAASISKLELEQNGAQGKTARKLAEALGVEVKDLRHAPE